MSWPSFPRLLGILAILGSCIGADAVPTTASGSCPVCRVGPYRNCYGYGRNYSYAGAGYGARSTVSCYGSYQPFGTAHPRSLIGQYGYGYARAGYPSGYASTLIRHQRLDNAFPFRSSINSLRFGRSFVLPVRTTFPRYRVYFGDATPTRPETTFGGMQFVSTETSDLSVPVDAAWILLAEGDAMNAVVAFAKRISDNPGNMLAKVGLALSLAAAGDLTAGAWHMRQACSSGVNVLKIVRLNDTLQHQVHGLIDKYQSVLVPSNANRQKLFMLASLNYLAGEQQAASASIASAIRNGDRTSVARHLQDLIANYGVDRQPALAHN